MENVRICLGEWELYNNGIVLMDWYDQNTNLEDVYEHIKAIKKENGLNGDDLELFCADWENDVLNIVSEHSNIEEVFNTYNEIELDDLKEHPHIFLFNKVALGYLYYQFVTAVRKDTRK